MYFGFHPLQSVRKLIDERFIYLRKRKSKELIIFGAKLSFFHRISQHGVRILYYIKEYVPIKDSSNLTIEDWVTISLDIREHYADYEGIVVIHGTDTMAYTASALSFMLENLGKTVILTGSQV